MAIYAPNKQKIKESFIKVNDKTKRIILKYYITFKHSAQLIYKYITGFIFTKDNYSIQTKDNVIIKTKDQ